MAGNRIGRVEMGLCEDLGHPEAGKRSQRERKLVHLEVFASQVPSKGMTVLSGTFSWLTVHLAYRTRMLFSTHKRSVKLPV